jgi:hypothetical protein
MDGKAGRINRRNIHSMHQMWFRMHRLSSLPTQWLRQHQHTTVRRFVSSVHLYLPNYSCSTPQLDDPRFAAAVVRTAKLLLRILAIQLTTTLYRVCAGNRIHGVLSTAYRRDGLLGEHDERRCPAFRKSNRFVCVALGPLSNSKLIADSDLMDIRHHQPRQRHRRRRCRRRSRQPLLLTLSSRERPQPVLTPLRLHQE